MLKGRYILILFSLVIFPLIVAGQPSVYTVKKIEVNSQFYNEIAPAVTPQGLYFCSDRRINPISTKYDFSNNRLFNLYFARRIDSTRFEKPVRLRSRGSDFTYFGPLSVTGDGKTIYFTSSILPPKDSKKKNAKAGMGIFIGDLSGSYIENIRPFEHNSTEYKIAHPAISPDGKYLFFASDMLGGYGESDLYYCENINGKWSKPVNMGSKVNSEKRDSYPCFHPSGRLYFSSDRKGSASFMGGLDVYYTSLVYGEWETPVPLPEPINSTGDDFAFAAEENLQSGYFSRTSALNDDIWQFRSSIRRMTDCDSLVENYYCYRFEEMNALRQDTLPPTFRFRWSFGDGETAEGIVVEHCYKGPGRYTVKLDIVNLLTNEVLVNQKTETFDIQDAIQPYITAPDSAVAGVQIRLDAGKTNLPGWEIAEYYWNLGDDSVELGREITKSYTRPGVYNVQLIVTSAPDANGRVQEACVARNIRVMRNP